jgi:hypothetical protein
MSLYLSDSPLDKTVIRPATTAPKRGACSSLVWISEVHHWKSRRPSMHSHCYIREIPNSSDNTIWSQIIHDLPWYTGDYKWRELIFVCVVLGFELRAYTLSHFHQPFFVMGFYEIRSRKLFARAGLEPGTTILLISASWVGRITGVSHQGIKYIHSWSQALKSFIN